MTPHRAHVLTIPNPTARLFPPRTSLTLEVADASRRSNAGWLFTLRPSKPSSTPPRFLRPAKQACRRLDPCGVGEGRRRQLGELLGCPKRGRSPSSWMMTAALPQRHVLPAAQIFGPANFFGCRASLNSFSFIWLNPPFDDAYGGHRVEEHSADGHRMAHARRRHGLDLPEDVADEFTDVRRHFALYYENCMIVPFPKTQRRFNEVVVLGHKRASQRPSMERAGLDPVLAPEGFSYLIFRRQWPQSVSEGRADGRRAAHLARAVAPARPPTDIAASTTGVTTTGAGNRSCRPALGKRPSGRDSPSTRRASPRRAWRFRKRDYIADVTETVNPDGSTTTKTTLSQRIELVIRTVDVTGELPSGLTVSVTSAM